MVMGSRPDVSFSLRPLYRAYSLNTCNLQNFWLSSLIGSSSDYVIRVWGIDSRGSNGSIFFFFLGGGGGGGGLTRYTDTSEVQEKLYCMILN